jgi:hypothetical protein
MHDVPSFSKSLPKKRDGNSRRNVHLRLVSGGVGSSESGTRWRQRTQ